MLNKSLYKDPVILGWAIPTTVALAVYLSTMCRTVYVGDSGEFSLAMMTLGVAHPPGYPLFTIIGHVFVTLLGFLKPALAANLFGVILAVAAIPPLFFLLDGRKNAFLAGCLCLLWAFTPVFWEETLGIEVYALNLTLVAAIMALAFSNVGRRWYIIAYLLGLTLAHHLSALAVIPPLVYLFFQEDKSYRQPYLKYALFFVLGLSLYLYVPIRSSMSPLVDWGHPASLDLLFNHITAARYRGFVEFSFDNLKNGLTVILSLLHGNWWWMGWGLIAWGIYSSWNIARKQITFALLLLASNLALSSFYQILDIDSYFLPGLLAGWWLMSLGVLNFSDRFRAQRKLTAVTCAAAALLLVAFHFGELNRSGCRLAYDYGKLILDSAGSGTVFTMEDNANFTTLYLRYGEGYQPQVEVYDRLVRMNALIEEGDRLAGKPVNDYFEAREAYIQRSGRPIFLTKSNLNYEEAWKQISDSLYPSGILYSVARPVQPAPIPDLWSGEEPIDSKMRQILVNLELSRGEDLLFHNPPDTAAADRYFRRALDLMQDEPRSPLHNLLGMALRRFGAEDLALTSYERGLAAPRLGEETRAKIIFNISNVYKDRGNRLVKANELAGAVEAFEKALEYDPNNTKLMYNVGVIYAQYLQQPDKGLPYLESYLQVNPSDQNAANLVRQLRGQ